MYLQSGSWYAGGSVGLLTRRSMLILRLRGYEGKLLCGFVAPLCCLLMPAQYLGLQACAPRRFKLAVVEHRCGSTVPDQCRPSGFTCSSLETSRLELDLQPQTQGQVGQAWLGLELRALWLPSEDPDVAWNEYPMFNWNAIVLVDELCNRLFP